MDAFAGDQRFSVNERYTGLIVDGSDAGFSPALAPRVVEESSGKVVFGPHLVQMAAITAQGPVGYAPTLGEARTNARVGANPLIVRAVEARGGRKGDLALSARDAERVLAADRDGRFLDKGAVVVVLGKDQRELAAQPGKRHAIVIGVENYPQGQEGAPPPLSFAARDARAIASALGGASGAGTITLLVNEQATRDGVVNALRALRGTVKDEDSVVVFFSGHGSVGVGPDARGHYFLVPRDGRLTDLAGTALMDVALEGEIGQLPARQIVVILDTCYSGGGGGVIRARGVTNTAAGSVAPTRSLIEASAGRVVISAARPDQVAFEDDQRGAGVFTSFLLEGLAGPADLNGDGVISALELFQFVSPKVREYSRRQFQVEQTPVLEVRALSGDEIALMRRR
ncbi:MAG: caspase family protein [Candidatus Rokubacteria bacterium]|nr:caspase family protein [Candidatus Rokubacteria bacterium]